MLQRNYGIHKSDILNTKYLHSADVHIFTTYLHSAMLMFISSPSDFGMLLTVLAGGEALLEHRGDGERGDGGGRGG